MEGTARFEAGLSSSSVPGTVCTLAASPPNLTCLSLPLPQMASSDERLKQNEGGDDAMDAALAFGDGPAKEMFGVELSAL